MQSQNPTKSIIYGNTFSNKYGKFLPICSSIVDRNSIASIMDYLKETPHFKKFNRVAYAYRVDELPVVFITEKKNIESHYYEGCHSDETIEGSGEKLLHLLEKFNIRNVLIAVLVQQFHPLLPFECVNYRAIVENSRMLLDQLYKKVVQFQESYPNMSTEKNIGIQLMSEEKEKAMKMNRVDMSEEITIPLRAKVVPKQRPNYVYNSSTQSLKPAAQPKPTAQSLNQKQLQFLWSRLKTMKAQHKKLSQSLEEKELQELKYFFMYDKNPLINIVIQLFTIYEGMGKEQIIEGYDFGVLRGRELEAIEGDRLRKMDQILKVNRKICVDSVLKVNRALGMLFSIMEIAIRYSKNLERIGKMIEKAEHKSNILAKQMNSNVMQIDVTL